MKAMVIDLTGCVGCYNCQIGCKDEHCGNDWMPYAKPQPETGQFWMKMRQWERGKTPQVKVAYVPVLCMHCADAPCAAACTPKAINTRPDGLVVIDPQKCTGCQLCVPACPYGAIYFNSALQIAQKCTGCAHLIDRGWPIKVPRCVDNCQTDCMTFGEEADLKDLIAKAEVLPPNFGTAPKVRVYYIGLPKRFIAGTVYDPATKEVVIGATCTLSGAGTATATTDDFGDFWFEGLKVGTFSLQIASGSKTKTISSINTEKDVALGDIPLT
jgi:tetrathionate reductase subunit B